MNSLTTRTRKCLALFCGVTFIIYLIAAAYSHVDNVFCIDADNLEHKIVTSNVPVRFRAILDDGFIVPMQGRVCVQVGRQFPFQDFLVIEGESHLGLLSEDKFFSWATDNGFEASIEEEGDCRTGLLSRSGGIYINTYNEVRVSFRDGSARIRLN